MNAATQIEDGYRVLILPHTRRDGDVASALLRRSGIACEVLENAATLALALREPVGAVVITDAALRDPDFARVTAALGGQPAWSDIPVVLLGQDATATAAAERLRESLTNVTLLNRPTSVRTLLSSVQAALRGRRRQYQARDQMRMLRETEETVRTREQQLHTLAENSPDILSRFDRSFRHVFVNQAATRNTGLTRDALIGRTSRELGMPPQLCDVFERTLTQVFQTGEPQTVEFTFPGPAGALHYTSSVVPEFGTGGEVQTVLSVSRDVTERKKAEDALRAADRRKDEFLAMLAHELRNPLAPIRSASELLGRVAAADPSTQAIVGIVKRQVAHLTRLVDDLLDVSRITQGRIELQRAPIELLAVIVQALESVDPLVREKGHRVERALGDAPLYVHGDSARLVQCLVNLLANAAKYTDAGGTIRIAVRQHEAQAIITINDTGIGITKELLPQIFELFVQGERALDRSQGGLGIGLSVVKRLVEMHGGVVAVSSPGVGQGSTFEVRLPLIPAPGETPMEVAEASAAGRRILIVDDNADAADSLALLLSLNGHNTQSVYVPEEALARTLQFRPQIVLLDIGLPRIDGYEVARRIRAQDGAVRLIALTGYGQRDDVERAREAGFDAHLIKPVDLAALDRLLAEPAAGFRSGAAAP
jgi:PAS domain S-box-containing protein